MLFLVTTIKKALFVWWIKIFFNWFHFWDTLIGASPWMLLKLFFYVSKEILFVYVNQCISVMKAWHKKTGNKPAHEPIWPWGWWNLNQNTNNLIVLENVICKMSTILFRPQYKINPWDIGNNVYTQVTNCFSAHERWFWCLFPELRSNEGNKHQNNTRVTAETVRHKCTYIILFLTQHNESINDDKNNDLYALSQCLTHSVFVLLMTSQSIADDTIMTRQLWRDHVNNDILTR